MPNDGDTERSPDGPSYEASLRLLQELVRRTHLSAASDVAGIVAEEAASIGATEVTLHLIDYEQDVLVQLPRDGAPAGEPLPVTGTLAGRCFITTAIIRASGDEPGRQRLWLPLLDGTERLGVMGMSLPAGELPEGLIETAERFSHTVAMTVATKSQYGDTFELIRRRKPMTIASELLWALVPPLVFATDDLVLAGMLEPCYDNGGDALDYAVDDRVLHAAVFDAMGHGLAAAGVAAFAVSAYRQSRRDGAGLLETHARMDAAVGEQFPDSRFVTAVIAELELDTGRLRWVTAGHPPPVVIRGSRHVRTLEAPPAPPLGVAFADRPPTVAEASLEPGDLLLFYTDGLTEARGPDGRMFTLEGLSQFIEREAAAGQTAPETLRRLRHALIGRERAELRDDATALLVEWRRGSETKLVAQTVL